MTARNDVNGVLSDWLDAQAGRGAPDYLAEVLARTTRTRQRPAWSSLERWLPMDLTASRLNPIGPVHLRTIAIVMILTALIAGLLVIGIGSRPAVPPPFGLARNGLLVASMDGDLFTVDQKTGINRPLIVDAATDFGPAFSRDGSRLLFLRGDDAIPSRGLQLVVANADGSGVHAITPFVDGLDWVDWSPDGTRITFLTRELGRGRINFVNVDGTGLRSIDVHQPANEMSWLPPNGDELIFRGEHLLDSDPPAAILAVRPDGTGLRQISILPPLSDSDYQDVAVAPDGSRVAYRGAPPDGLFSVHVLDLRTRTDLVLPAPPNVAQGGPTFSPDGRSILYIRWNANHTTQLVVAPADGSGLGVAIGPVALSGAEGPTITNYAFSPDGAAVLANFEAERVEQLLPVDGSASVILARGELAFGSFQRLAP